MLNVRLQASQISDGILEKLGPVKQQPLNDSCFEGTRVNILKEAVDWLEDSKLPNILWIVGAPGAGKSTIATTLARELAATCARFFCERDVPDFRDPRQIWRTLAYRLADNHDGMKAALKLALSEKTCKPQDDLVLEQFKKLFENPLPTISKETVYPVIIIDALDECDSATITDWKSLLTSLNRWSMLPRKFKLIVTSRDLHDIRTMLGEVSYHVVLATGDGASEDSNSDIRIFLTKKFGEIRQDFPSLSYDWPTKEEIEVMTNFAAGLFIWANMVVSFIAQRTANDPIERLQMVLDDIKTQSGIEGCDQVDLLYARIIFEAIRRSTHGERNKAKSILAAVLLAKGPLRKSDLVTLLSTDTWNSSIMIESTLRGLSPIIISASMDNADDELRFCHKTVSDFLSSRKRSPAAMGHFVQKDQLHSYLIDDVEDSRSFALACVHLVRRNFSLDIHSIATLLKESNRSLDYAHQHWFEHLEDAGGSRVPNLKCLADAMKLAYGRLQRYAPQMMLAEEEAIALTASLSDAAEFASRCIDGASNGNLFCSSK